MASGSIFEAVGSRLSQAGGQLPELFQLVQNTQRQNEQDVFQRKVQIQQFENQAAQLRQGQERIDLSRSGQGLEAERIGVANRQADISQQRADLSFAESQGRILGTLGGGGLDFSGLPRTTEGLAVGLAARGIPQEEIQSQISPLQGLLDPPTPGATPSQLVGGDIFSAVQSGTAALRRSGAEVDVLDESGQRVPVINERTGRQSIGLDLQPLFETQPAAFDTASAIRGQLFGGEKGFDPGDPRQVREALGTASQISPELGGFIDRSGLGADAEPAVEAAEPVGIQGQQLFNLNRPKGDTFDIAISQIKNAADWKALTPREQTDLAKEQARLDHPEFDESPADKQQEFIQESVNDIEAILGII